ncbi:MAG: glycoside hydrolase family 104 protein [Actinomycetia bacterium]|nr:glycoside hydrolase family 104 protein [Actinomycetes bacterium]
MRSTTINSETDTANSPARTRRSRTLLLAGATLVALTASACNLPVEQWVPDFDGDGVISQAEIDRQSGVIIAAVTESVEQQRREVQQHSFLTCVRRHESDRTGAWPHIGGYTAQNPRSSASGAYQFIDSTWRTVASRAGHPGYAKASHAPWYVQDAVALHTINNGGRSHWNGTGC